MSDRLILWDFDGTLAYRVGMWRGAMIETLDEHEAGHGVHIDALRPHLRDGFPWHRAEVGHPELTDADAWWAPVQELMARAYVAVGIEAQRAVALARLARRRFVDPDHGWRLFDDTLAVLAELADEGWRHVILSNHVPELPELAAALGLASRFERIHTSALIGYEKPHPRAFEIALAAAGHPATVWMVGDNPVADIAGARALGIPAVLVRRDAPGLRHAARIIRAGATRAQL